MKHPRTGSLEQLVRNHGSTGVVLDTNILLLYVVGGANQDHVERFKRTKHFSSRDYLTLHDFVARFRRVVTTPNILTEASNLFGHRDEFRQALATELDVLDEEYLESHAYEIKRLLPTFGLADAVNFQLAKRGLLILTDDLKLYDRIWRAGFASVNFTHLRTF